MSHPGRNVGEVEASGSGRAERTERVEQVEQVERTERIEPVERTEQAPVLAAASDPDEREGSAPTEVVVPGWSTDSGARAAALEARGAELAGVLAVAAAGLVEVLAEAITTEAWRGYGIRSVEHWAAVRFALSSGRARRLVAAAHGLATLPACRQAFAAGEITEDHVAAVVRAGVGPTHDVQALTLARHGTVAQLERALSFLPPVPPGDADPSGAPASEPPVRERLWTGFEDDGSWTITGKGDGDRGAVVDRALLMARDQLFRARHQDRDPDPGDLAAISGMDALEHVAKLALDALDPATGAGRRPSERYVIDVHVDASAPHAGRLHLGPALPAWLTSLVTCDAEVRPWLVGPADNVNLGRRQRTVDPKLRKVVEHRDGGCRIPGCDATRWLTIHHLHHWADGGPTDSPNLVALCPAHHRLVHAGQLHLRGNADGDDLAVTTGDGRPFGPSPLDPTHLAPVDAAVEARLPAPQWTNRCGERAQWRWFTWLEHPPSGVPVTVA